MTHRPLPPKGLHPGDAIYLSPQQEVFVAQCAPYYSKQVIITRNGQPYDTAHCAFRIYRVIASTTDPVMVFRARNATLWYDLPTKDLWKVPVHSDFHQVSFSPWNRWVVFIHNDHFSVFDTWSRSVRAQPLPEGFRGIFTMCRFRGPDEVLILMSDHSMTYNLPQGYITHQYTPFTLPRMRIGPLLNVHQLLMFDQQNIWCQSLSKKQSSPVRLFTWKGEYAFTVTIDWSLDGQTLYLLDHQSSKRSTLTLFTREKICAVFTLPVRNFVLLHGILIYDTHQWTIHPWIRVQPYQDALSEHLPAVLAQLVMAYRFPLYFCQHPHIQFPDL